MATHYWHESENRLPLFYGWTDFQVYECIIVSTFGVVAEELDKCSTKLFNYHDDLPRAACL